MANYLCYRGVGYKLEIGTCQSYIASNTHQSFLYLFFQLAKVSGGTGFASSFHITYASKPLRYFFYKLNN